MSEKYTTINIVLDRILRHPMMQDLQLETAVDYVIDFMQIVGVPGIFVEKTQTIPIHEYRGALPCDWYQTIQIQDPKTHLCLRYATDSFFTKDVPTRATDSTFMIQGDIIYTGIKEGEILMSYSAIATDEEGYPLIPDNRVFLRAVEEYIKKQWFYILFDMGKITISAIQNVEQRYAWAVGACETEFHKLDLSKAESFFNSYKTLLIRDNEFKKGFVNNGAKEVIKTH